MPDLDIDRKPKSTKYSLNLMINVWVFMIFIICSVTSGLLLLSTLPSLSQLQGSPPTWRMGVHFQDRQGRNFAQWGGNRQTKRPLSHFPDHLILALLASEDQRFYTHMGVDPLGIMRAVWLKISRGGRSQGGSTLTQQLAKAWVGKERSLYRKLREAVLAFKMEYYFSKGELLERYMNQVYLGEGAYGFEEASWTYFAHSASSMSLAESSLLAALPPQPSALNPFKTPHRSRWRRDHVIQELRALDWIEGHEAERAYREPLPSPRAQPSINDWAPSYLIEVKRQL